MNYSITSRDKSILRQLARQVRELAGDPLNLERKRLWLAARAGRAVRPLILAEWSGVCDRRKPFDPVLRCAGKWARAYEGGLRQDIWRFESLKDDGVIEPVVNCAWHVTTSNYGVEVPREGGGMRDGQMTSFRWDPPVKDPERDFDKLKPRAFQLDRESSLAEKTSLESVFDGILPVRFRNGYWWSLGLTINAIDLIGLEPLMLWMYDQPEALRRLLRFLSDDWLAYFAWLEKENLLTLNNENDYVGSGSLGYTAALPRSGQRPGAPASLKDMWGLIESQETVGVGPDLFAEFIWPYQRELGARFGLVYYGCCEPVHSRIGIIMRLKNLAAVSVSPWADQERMAQALGTKIIFSRKPNPAMISTGRFDEAAIRADLRATLQITRRHGCRVELNMKDVHTLNNEPERLKRWVAIAREEIDGAG